VLPGLASALQLLLSLLAATTSEVEFAASVVVILLSLGVRDGNSVIGEQTI